jgi:hypothetical protein
MPIPQAFLSDGYTTIQQARKRRCIPGLNRPGVMISIEGEADSGKTEFILTCPGPGIVLAVDRGHDAIFDNPNPPATRRDDFVFDIIPLALNSMAASANDYLTVWREYYARYKKALSNPIAKTVAVDGDALTWDLQRLAEFGKLTQILPINYQTVNSARKAMLTNAHDSGKVFVCTYEISDEYVEKVNSEGVPELDKMGKPVQIKSGEKVRKGFNDKGYLWNIKILTMRKPASTFTNRKGVIVEVPVQFGIKILKAKGNTAVEGIELWNEDSTFSGLIQTIYPHIPLEEWGL